MLPLDHGHLMALGTQFRKRVHGLQLEAAPEPRKPIFGSLPGCCARAASGKPATAPPSKVMNSRRFTRYVPTRATILDCPKHPRLNILCRSIWLVSTGISNPIGLW
jgi:hypothetical protein